MPRHACTDISHLRGCDIAVQDAAACVDYFGQGKNSLLDKEEMRRYYCGVSSILWKFFKFI